VEPCCSCCPTTKTRCWFSTSGYSWPTSLKHTHKIHHLDNAIKRRCCSECEDSFLRQEFSPNNKYPIPTRFHSSWMATLKNDLSLYNLTYEDAIEMALDKPLWGLLAASGAMHWRCMPNNDDDDEYPIFGHIPDMTVLWHVKTCSTVTYNDWHKNMLFTPSAQILSATTQTDHCNN